MFISGLVAILDDKGNFVETRDLGKGTNCKPGRVVPLEEYKAKHPELFPEEGLVVEQVQEISVEVITKVVDFLKENPDVAEVIGAQLDGNSIQ